MGQAQNPILTTMDIKRLETYIMDEWIFIPVAVVVMINAFALGLLMGWIWVACS